MAIGCRRIAEWPSSSTVLKRGSAEFGVGWGDLQRVDERWGLNQRWMERGHVAPPRQGHTLHHSSRLRAFLNKKH
jgi:hypothetical protein